MAYPSSGGLTTEQVEILDALPKAYFTGSTDTTIDISEDSSDPTYLSGYNFVLNCCLGFEWDDTYGAIKNISGRSLICATGIIGYQMEQSGGTDTLYFMSETSDDDGATWTVNDESLRNVEVSNSGESLKTNESEVLNLADNSMVRFRFWTSNDVEFVAQTATVDGTTYSGKSLLWRLTES